MNESQYIGLQGELDKAVAMADELYEGGTFQTALDLVLQMKRINSLCDDVSLRHCYSREDIERLYQLSDKMKSLL